MEIQARSLAMGVIATLLLTAAAVSAWGSGGPGSEWPGWRGPHHDGKAADASAFRLTEHDGLRVAWKRALGTGYSSVSVAAGHAVTMFGDGADDFVISLDPNSGLEQWRYRIGPTFRAPVQSNDGPLSTPAIDDAMVFALSPRGTLLALDLQTGKLIWSRDLVSEYGAAVPYFGFATSPLVADGLVYVEAGAPNRSVLAFDTQTGAYVRSAGDDSVTYQSPIVANLAGELQLVFAGDQYIYGVRLQTGEILWKHEHGVRADPEAVKQVLLGPGDLNPICPVAVGDDRLLLTNYYNPAAVLFRVTQSSGEYSVAEVWRQRSLRKSYAPPVASGDKIFGFASRFATCVDALTGEMAWKSRAPGDGALIGVGDLLVFLTKDQGRVHIARQSGEQYEELTSVPVFDDLTWTPPSYAEGMIFARSFREIAAVEIDRGVKAATPQPASGAAIRTTSRSGFLQFVERVRAAPAEQREPLVDEFFRTQKQFPIIEGERTVHVVYRGHEQDLAVEGDMLEAGEQAAMTHVEGTSFYFASFDLEPDARVDYKISKNFKSALILDPLNPRKVAVPGDEYSEIAMPRWSPSAYLNGVQPDSHGTIQRIEFASAAMNARRGADVYLPPGYAATSERYPVLYMPNGKEAEEFGKVTAALDFLISERRIKPVIAVFIDGPNRYKEFAGDMRDSYAEMVVRELIPRVDDSFRTLAMPAGRAILGPHTAGYAAVYAAFKYPNTFGKVAGQSTHLFGPLGGADLVRMVRSSPHLGIRFYFGWGTYDLRGRGVQRRPGMMDWRKDSMDFVHLLAGKGYDVTGREYHQGWGWSSWRNYIGDILEHFFSAGESKQANPALH
jgi:enterochelin esterase-like enzyme/outer membrane protein assembly factor BamB